MRASLLLMTSLIPTAAVAQPIRLSCSVSGEKLLVPALSAASVCERMRVALGKEMGTPLRMTTAPITASDRDGWIRVSLRFTKPGIASAKLERATAGRIVVHPDVNIAVSDRPMDGAIVDQMAKALADQVDAGRRRR